jgi:hypothetical protein
MQTAVTMAGATNDGASTHHHDHVIHPVSFRRIHASERRPQEPIQLFEGSLIVFMIYLFKGEY